MTDDAFKKRIDEVKFAKEKLEAQKSETIIKIQEVEEATRHSLVDLIIQSSLLNQNSVRSNYWKMSFEYFILN